MADLAELTGAGRVDIFPGFQLATLDLLDYGECEREFEAKHVAFAKAAASGQHPDVAEKIISKALRDVENGKFAFGTDSFDLEALKAQHLPFLLFLELRRNHADMTREKAGELLRASQDQPLVQDVICANAGYSITKKNAASPTPSADPSTGTVSSQPSESPDSPTVTSPDSPSAS